MVNSIEGVWRVQKDTNSIFTISYGLYNFIYKSQ